MNVPGAHAFWSWWTVTLVHLREVPGVPPPHLKYPEAEYEFTIFSINPEACPEPDPDAVGHPILTPPDVVEQFHGVSDEDAERICLGAVQAIVNGHISPDQDYRGVWKMLMAGTVEHFRQGAHVVH